MSRSRDNSGYSKSYQLEMARREKGTRRQIEKEKEVRRISKKD